MYKPKIIVAGSRFLKEEHYPIISNVLDRYIFSEIISGGASGADCFGELYAEENNIPLKLFLANWHKYGKSAGYIRNTEMGKYADEAIVFWNLKSSGSKHMINIMVNKFHKPTHVYVL